jgi:flagellar hook-associated protein 2
MSSITAPTYDPTSTAQAMAQKFTATAQDILTSQTKAASASSTALTKLSSAISAFQTSLSSLTGLGKSVLAQTATLSDSTIGTASAKATASSGSYSLFVKQLATASQVSYNNLANGVTPGGTLTIRLSDETPGATTPAITFPVDLSSGSADTDKDGVLSIREIAAAINRASGNNGLVSAGVITIGNESRLVLTSKNTGVANTVSVDPTGVADPGLKAGLQTRSVVAAAQDAIVMLGGQTNGTEIRQSSNTFTNIDGVSMTFTRAQAATEKDITLNVAGNASGTVSNVQAFVDAYNKLKSVIDAMVDPGDPTNNKDAGAFAHDAGIKALQSRLVSLVRSTGSSSLAAYGVTATRDGTLSLDSARLTRQLNVNPTGLDSLLGSSSSSNPAGITGALNTYLNQWSNSVNGQIKQRTDATTKLQSTLTQRQTDLDAQYDAAYSRYLKQFTDLQTLQSKMTSNVSLFDALFSSDKSS